VARVEIIGALREPLGHEFPKREIRFHAHKVRTQTVTDHSHNHTSHAASVSLASQERFRLWIWIRDKGARKIRLSGTISRSKRPSTDADDDALRIRTVARVYIVFPDRSVGRSAVVLVCVNISRQRG